MSPTSVQQALIDFTLADLNKKKADKAEYAGMSWRMPFTRKRTPLPTSRKRTRRSMNRAPAPPPLNPSLRLATTMSVSAMTTTTIPPRTIPRKPLRLSCRNCRTAESTWDNDAYTDAGELKDDLSPYADTAKTIANLKAALAAANATTASTELSALNSAKALNKAANATLKTAAENVTAGQKAVKSGVKGAGDSIVNRIAETVAARQKTYDGAEARRAKDADNLQKATTALRTAEGDETARRALTTRRTATTSASMATTIPPMPKRPRRETPWPMPATRSPPPRLKQRQKRRHSKRRTIL